MQIDYSKRIFGLDIMRAVAILLVVFSHALWIVPEKTGIIPDILSLSGVIGVEIFFVLSGYLIGRIVYNIFLSDDFSFNKVIYFWFRRWFRTLPNYYLILLINIFLAFYLGSALPDNLFQYFYFFQNFAWEMPVFFSESWSLPIEEFAYIIGPLLIYLVLLLNLKLDKSKLFAGITISIILFFTITKIAYNINVPNSDMMFWNTNLKSVTIYRIDAIYFGVLASYISIVMDRFWKKHKWFLFVLGGTIFLGLNILISKQGIFIENYPFFWNVLYLPINSIAITLSLPLLSHLKSAPKFILFPITFISLISYSMYLLHYSIILRLLKHFLSTDVEIQFNVAIYTSIYIFITILLSYFLYTIYEKPMMDIRDKPFITKKFN